MPTTQAQAQVDHEPALGTAHNAPLWDVRLLELLVTRVMPFGKHQGCLLADLPGHYLNWFARTGFPKGELGQLLALLQEIDHNGLRPMLDPLRHASRDNGR